MGRRWEELGNEITILPDDNHTAQMWHFKCPHQKLRHIFAPTHSEGKALPNRYIQMGGVKGKISRWPPLFT